MVEFAGRVFKYVGMHRKPAGRYPGNVLLWDDVTSEYVRARADMVFIVQ